MNFLTFPPGLQSPYVNGIMVVLPQIEASGRRIPISWCDCDTDTFSTLPKHQYEINLGKINVNTTIRL